MKVLILTLSTGQGHIQTAKAINEEFKKYSIKSEVLDLYKFLSPFLSDSVEKGYLLSSRYTPKLYGAIYDSLMNRKHKDGKNSFVTLLNNVLSSQKLRGILEDYKPDAVISTHPFCATVMTHMKKIISKAVNVGIITDFTIHPFWEETDMDYYVTASHLLDHQCVTRGIPKEKILPMGIPIAEKFTKKMSKDDACSLLGIKNKTTILFMMGSMGYGNIPLMISRIDRLNYDFQLICVCGRNKTALKKTQSLEFKHNVYVHGFVDNVDIMMDASDFIITKPGGLSMSESLAKGLPAILVKPIPGQENRNLEFFLNNGIASAVSKSFPIDEAVYQMLYNEWKFENAKDGVTYIGKPYAARDLCEFLIEKVGDKNESN